MAGVLVAVDRGGGALVGAVGVVAGGVGLAVGWLGKLPPTLLSADRDVVNGRQAATEPENMLAPASSRINVRRVITYGPPLCLAARPTRVI
jgi:hypothetical protein